MTDLRDDLRALADGVRARLESERWFGVTHMPGASVEIPEAPEAPAIAEEPVVAREPVVVEDAPTADTVNETVNETPATGAGMTKEEKAEALAALAQEVTQCDKCALAETRTNAVPGEGDPDARIMFIGEAPGRDEDAQGRPFVGRAGKLLDKMIVAMGLQREDVFIANILKCRPPQNRDPSTNEVVCCIGYLHRQIEIIQPEVIIALGRIAAQNLLQMDTSLGKMRGTFHDYRGVKFRVTYHPAFLLRSPSYKKGAWEDLQAVLRELGIPIPDHKKK